MLFSFTKKFKWILLVSGVLSLLTALASLALFHLIGKSGEQGFSLQTGAMYAGLWIFLLASSMLTSYALSFFTSKTILEVRLSLIQRILQSDFMTLEKAGRPKLYNVLTNDVNAIASALAELPAFIYNSILLLACFGYLFYLSPVVFGVLLSIIVLAALFANTIMRRISRDAAAMRARQDDMFESYKGMLEGAKQLALNSGRKQYYLEKNLRPQLDNLKESERCYGFSWDINRNISQSLIFLIIGGVIAINQYMQTGHLLMSYLIILTYLTGPFSYVMGLWQAIVRANVSLKKIEGLNLQPAAAATAIETSAVAVNRDWQTISFHQVGFHYQGTDNQFSLNAINLRLNKGEVVFVTGGNGSGKSTFIHTLLGLYQPTTGHVALDGCALDQHNAKAYRDKFAIVLPDFYLYNALLDRQATPVQPTDAVDLLARFDLLDRVECDEHGFKSVQYSMGQRKRLALISAILEDKDIYVLDEWAADQDPHFRHVFYTGIIPWLKARGKTVIAVTHDDKYFACADRRIKFDLGTLQEENPMQPAAAA
jgi:cyclic peptide transporter